MTAATTTDLDVGAPGWRRDPGNPRHITYWNGSRWTVHMRWDGADWLRCQEPHEPPPAPMADLAEALAVEGTSAASPVSDTTLVPEAAGASALDAAPAAAAVVAAGAAKALAPSRRRRRRLVGLVALLVLVAGGAGGLYVVKHRSTPAGPAASLVPSASAQVDTVLHRSLVAARSQGSVHVTSIESVGGVAVSAAYDLSMTQGQKTVTGGTTGNATIVSTPGSLYLKADAAFLEGNLGISAASAAKAAGTWIVLEPADHGYGQLVPGLTLASALLEATPTGTRVLSAQRVIDGVRVVGIAGGLPKAPVGAVTGRQTLYVEAAAPYLPVELDITGAVNGQGATSTVSFSQWRETATVTVPPSAVPASTLGP